MKFLGFASKSSVCRCALLNPGSVPLKNSEQFKLFSIFIFKILDSTEKSEHGACSRINQFATQMQHLTSGWAVLICCIQVDLLQYYIFDEKSCNKKFEASIAYFGCLRNLFFICLSLVTLNSSSIVLLILFDSVSSMFEHPLILEWYVILRCLQNLSSKSQINDSDPTLNTNISSDYKHFIRPSPAKPAKRLV